MGREGVLIVIHDSLMALRGDAPQVTECETVFIMLGSMNQLSLLLLYQSHYCTATSLPGLFDSISQLAMELLNLMILGDFNLPSLGVESEVDWEFMATMMATSLPR